MPLPGCEIHYCLFWTFVSSLVKHPEHNCRRIHSHFFEAVHLSAIVFWMLQQTADERTTDSSAYDCNVAVPAPLQALFSQLKMSGISSSG